MWVCCCLALTFQTQRGCARFCASLKTADLVKAKAVGGRRRVCLLSWA